MPLQSIEDPLKLRRVLEATLLLERDLDLPTLLGHVIDTACSLTDARFGALGVLNDDHTAFGEFLTVGLTPDEEGRIGPRPTGLGVLSLSMDDPRTIRLAKLGSHPSSVGFPPGHPPMDSFLGVPIRVRDEIYGSIYLTEKRGAPEFNDEDQSSVEALAVAAGMAIENTRLHQRIQDMAVSEDRDRMARDLHDTVIQHLFAVGLTLESMAGEAAADGLADRLTVLVSTIGDAITQVRASIYELGLAKEDSGVRSSVLAMVRSLNPTVGIEVGVTFEGPIDAVISDRVAEQLLATVREAVTNIGRHAEATRASVSLKVASGQCRLRVLDNGRGIDDNDLGTGTGTGGLGLVNLRRRAEKLHGSFTVERPDGGGTLLTWQVPVSA